MLKGVPAILSPEILKTLMEMGHGDEILIADGNFPSASHAQRLLRCDGHDIPELLAAIMKFFPLDIYAQQPAAVMAVDPDDDYKPEVWDDFAAVIKDSGEKCESFEQMRREAFYDRAKKAYAVIATSESSLYANLILRKGVV